MKSTGIAPTEAAIESRSATVSIAKPLRYRVDRNDPLSAQEEGAADGELRHRPATEDRDRFTAFYVAELSTHVPGREDVGQE
jgi:hypothetical protein